MLLFFNCTNWLMLVSGYWLLSRFYPINSWYWTRAIKAVGVKVTLLHMTGYQRGRIKNINIQVDFLQSFTIFTYSVLYENNLSSMF